MFSISSLILISKYEIILIYACPIIVFGTQTFKSVRSELDVLGEFLFLILFSVMASIVSNINYQSFVKDFIARMTILEKNKELKEMAALQKATFDNIPDTIMVYDTNLDLQHYNKAALDLFETSSSEFHGHKCYKVLGKEAECDDCVIKEVFRTKQHARLERQSDDYSRWLEIRAYPMLDDEDNVNKVIEHIRDITYLKKFEEELQRTNSILKTQLEASPDGIIVIDYKWRVFSFNNKFLDVWSIPINISRKSNSDELLQYILSNVNDKEKLILKIRELETLPFESSYSKIKLKNGTVLDCHSVPILLFEGESYGRVWYFRDITEKVKMDEALRKGAKENERLLKESLKYDELKSEFFSNISHELRTPINVLLGTLQLLNLKKVGGEDAESQKINKHIKIMKQNCYRLLRMTNNLIDITKMDTGFFEINLQNYNFIQVVEDITVSVAEYIENKGISLTFDTDVEEKIIALDADKIERIILNLLSNAVKFTKTNGSILVNIHDKGGSIEVTVSDTGIGIPEDKLEIIFERFRQVNSSLTRSSEGSGIGLSLVKSLVELHGGTIKVISQINKGSEFIMEFPCKTISKDGNKKPVAHNISHVERISIEFSDIYSC
jgi:PAS domain S-box-containing protein